MGHKWRLFHHVNWVDVHLCCPGYLPPKPCPSPCSRRGASSVTTRHPAPARPAPLLLRVRDCRRGRASLSAWTLTASARSKRLHWRGARRVSRPGLRPAAPSVLAGLRSERSWPSGLTASRAEWVAAATDARMIDIHWLLHQLQQGDAPGWQLSGTAARAGVAVTGGTYAAADCSRRKRLKRSSAYAAPGRWTREPASCCMPRSAQPGRPPGAKAQAEQGAVYLVRQRGGRRKKRSKMPRSVNFAGLRGWLRCGDSGF